MISYSCHAQDDQRLPDSVSVMDSVRSTVEENNSTTTTTTVTDTADQYKEKEDSVVFRKIPDSVIAAYKTDRNFLYANDDSYWTTPKPVHHKKDFFEYLIEFFGSPYFRWFLYIFFVTAILFILYRLIKENRLHMFYSAPKQKITEVAEETDMTYEDIDSKLQSSLAASDFRLAIRYMYLKALKKSGDKEIIKLGAQATNQEYVHQFARHAGEKEFRLLTNAYEYVWYGGFVPNVAQFESLQGQFNHFYLTIDH